MFVYDSQNDEFNEIFHDGENSPTWSRRSSNTSGRSNSSNLGARIISHTGRLNLYSTKIQNKNLSYFRDWGNTLLNIRWRWILVTIILVNFLCFIFFGLMWMWMAYISGDFEDDVQTPCVVNTKNLTGYILLSMETMLTIGYGYRYPTESCKQGWVVMFFEALVSVGVQGALVSLVYVKIAKPFTKNTLGIFSKKAVVIGAKAEYTTKNKTLERRAGQSQISLRDGKFSFIFRLVDVVGKVSVGTKISMFFIDKEDENEPLYMKEMKVEPVGFLIFPLEVVHNIDHKSPLWNIPAHHLLTRKIEILVVAEGNSMITSQPSQIRMSYRSSDILWGHIFEPCVRYNTKKDKFVINYSMFHETIPFVVPLCSPRDLYMIEMAYMNEYKQQ